MSIVSRRAYRSPLRQQQSAATRERILRACADLVARRSSLDISIPELARAAEVSQPTIYRYFPTKRALYNALVTLQFERVAAGFDPRSPEELADALPTFFQRALELEGLVRWSLATPLGSAGRPTRVRRLTMLMRAAGVNSDDPDVAELLPRLLLLLTSPIAALYWKDYLGLTTAEAARTAAWGIRRLTESRGTALQPADSGANQSHST